MFSQLHIQGFRGIQELEIDNLAEINLVTGQNNVGKTMLLESAFILAAGNNPELGMRVNAMRGMKQAGVKLAAGSETSMPWSNLFPGLDVSQDIVLEGRMRDGSTRIVRLSCEVGGGEIPFEDLSGARGTVEIPSTAIPARYSLVLSLQTSDGTEPSRYAIHVSAGGLEREPKAGPPLNPAVFLDAVTPTSQEELAHRFSVEVESKRDEAVVGALQLIAPSLTKLTVLTNQGTPTLSCDIGKARLLPIQVMGQGIVRLADIVLAFTDARQGVMLVDEIESGLHYSRYNALWQAMRAWCRDFDTQLIATTHSYECLSAAAEVFRESSEDEFALFRLDRSGRRHAATRFAPSELSDMVERGWEVR